MKRFLNCIVLILLLSFVFVLNTNADVAVKIKNVKLVSKSDATKIINEPKFEGTDLSLGLQLYKIGDYAEYKVTLSNSLDEQVVISNNGKSTSKSNDFLVYNYIWDDNNSVIPAKGNKSFNLKVEYAKPVSDSKFDSAGNYNYTDTLKIELNTDGNAIINKKTNNNYKNIMEDSPETGDKVFDYIALSIIAITLVFDIVYFGLIKKKNKKLNIVIMILSGVFIILSLVIKITFAISYYTINVKSSVKISKLSKMARSCASYVYSNDSIRENYEDWVTDFTTYSDTNYIEYNHPEIDNYCIDWNEIVPIDTSDYFVDGELNREKYSAGKLLVTTTNEMSNKYTYNNIEYTLSKKLDVSENQDGTVVLGVYKNGEKYLLLIGGVGGVIAPEDSSFLFAGNYNMHNYLYKSSKVNAWIDNSYSYGKKSNIMGFIDSFDLNNLDVSKVENMNGMFLSSSFGGVTKFDITNWNTSSLKYMNLMFKVFGASSTMLYLDLNNINTSNVTDMIGTFNGTGSKALNSTLLINKWDTSKVTNMYGMFQSFACGANVFNLSIANWNTKSVENMAYAFAYTGQISTAYNLNLSGWETPSIKNMEYMFAHSGRSGNVYFINNMTILPKDASTIFSGVKYASLITVKDCDTKRLLLDSMADDYGYSGENKIVSASNPMACSN